MKQFPVLLTQIACMPRPLPRTSFRRGESEVKVNLAVNQVDKLIGLDGTGDGKGGPLNPFNVN